MSGSIIFFVLGTFAIAWMATVVFVLTLCRMAALADSVDAPPDQVSVQGVEGLRAPAA